MINNNLPSLPDEGTVELNKIDGSITVIPGEKPKELNITIIATTKDGKETSSYSFIIHAKNIFEDIKGVHYNLTTWVTIECHKTPIPPSSSAYGVGYTDTYHGHDNVSELIKLYPLITSVGYYMNNTWDIIIEEEGDYKFYLGVYDTGALYIDGNEIIRLDEICGDEPVEESKIVHLTTGRHHMVCYTEVYMDSKKIAYLSVLYSKPNSDERLPLSTLTDDDSFDPVYDVYLYKNSYNFQKDNFIPEVSIASWGNRQMCATVEPLPKGLYFSSDFFYITGKPTEIQEAKTYHIYCMNYYSISNYFEFTIKISDNLHPGIIASYIKPNTFDETCITFYTAEKEKTTVYVNRHENEIVHIADNITKRLAELPPVFNGEYSAVFEAYIKIEQPGEYTIQIEISDSFQLSIGDKCGGAYVGCSDVQLFTQNCIFEEGFYGFYFITSHNYQTQFINFTMLYNNVKIIPQFYYYTSQTVIYNYTEVIYQRGVEICPNRLLDIPKEGIKSITVVPELPAGLVINKDNGEITGTATEVTPVNTYNITIVTNDNHVYDDSIKITVEYSVLPTDFFVYDLLNEVEIFGEIEYPLGKEMKFEIKNKQGRIWKYTPLDGVPSGFQFTNENDRYVISGRNNGSFHLLDVFFKAYSGHVMVLKELIIHFTPDPTPLECHYPFIYFYRYPTSKLQYAVSCNKKVSLFKLDSGNPDILSVAAGSGKLTITPPADSKSQVETINAIIKATTSDDEVYEIKLTIEGNNTLVSNGLHYNFTSFTTHNCHNPWSNPIGAVEGNTITNTFKGYSTPSEFDDLFPLARYIPYTLYLTWNMTIDEEDDYTFYISMYDTVQLSIDNYTVVDEFQICSKEIQEVKGDIHLTKGKHSVLLFIESYTDSVDHNYFLIYYGKTSDPITRLPIPTEFINDEFDPVVGLSSSNYEFKLLKDAETTIEFTVQSGGAASSFIECYSLETLPEGLEIDWNYLRIIGNPKQVQQAKTYHYQCKNVYSISNIITFTIEVTDNITPGLLAYYMKANEFDQHCMTIYEPGKSDNQLLIVRREFELNHVTLINERWYDLLPDFINEFSLVLKGYIKFPVGGKVTIHTKHSDSINIMIGEIGLLHTQCENIRIDDYAYDIAAGIYPIYLGYTNNYYTPYMEIAFLIDNEEIEYELFYGIYIYYYYLNSTNI